MTSLYLKRDVCLPPAREEVKAVREILTELEETPVHDKKLWLKHEYDIHFGPQPAVAIYDSAPEFMVADGHVLDSFLEFDSVMGGCRSDGGIPLRPLLPCLHAAECRLTALERPAVLQPCTKAQP